MAGAFHLHGLVDDTIRTTRDDYENARSRTQAKRAPQLERAGRFANGRIWLCLPASLALFYANRSLRIREIIARKRAMGKLQSMPHTSGSGCLVGHALACHFSQLLTLRLGCAHHASADGSGPQRHAPSFERPVVKADALDDGCFCLYGRGRADSRSSDKIRRPTGRRRACALHFPVASSSPEGLLLIRSRFPWSGHGASLAANVNWRWQFPADSLCERVSAISGECDNSPD